MCLGFQVINLATNFWNQIHSAVCDILVGMSLHKIKQHLSALRLGSF